MSGDIREYLTRIAVLSRRVRKLEKFYDDVQSAMDHYTGLNHLATLIDEATEECCTNEKQTTY